MGLTGNSPGSLILLFLIAVLLFGSKRLASLGEDLGKAVRGFKQGLKEETANNKQITEDDDDKYNR